MELAIVLHYRPEPPPTESDGSIIPSSKKQTTLEVQVLVFVGVNPLSKVENAFDGQTTEKALSTLEPTEP